MGEFPAPWGPVCTPTAASPHLHPPVKPHLGEMGPSGAESAPGYPGGNFPARVKRSQRAGAGPRSLPGTRHCGSVSIPRTRTSSGAQEEAGISRGKRQREPGTQPGWGDRKGAAGAATGWTRGHCPVSSHWFPGPGHPAGSLATPRHLRSHCSGREQSPCSPWGHTGTDGTGSNGSPESDPISLASLDVTGSVPLVPRAQATMWRRQLCEATPGSRCLTVVPLSHCFPVVPHKQKNSKLPSSPSREMKPRKSPTPQALDTLALHGFSLLVDTAGRESTEPFPMGFHIRRRTLCGRLKDLGIKICAKKSTW